MNETTETKEETGTKEGTPVSNQDSKLKAALSCIPIVGLVMFIVEKEDKRVRFYAAQGMLLGVAGMLIAFVPIIGWLAQLLILAGMVMTGVKAYQTEEYYKLPLLGDWAEKWANN